MRSDRVDLNAPRSRATSCGSAAIGPTRTSPPRIQREKAVASLTDATIRLARSKRGLLGIFVASFAESTVVPVPFETIMVPMLLANREKIWLIATVTTLGCLLGALAGYAVGYFAFETVGRWLLELLNATEQFESFQSEFDQHGFWIIFSVGIFPIPFQVATVGSGLAAYPLVPFLVAATLARSLRYYGLALLVMLFGERVATFIKRHQTKTKIAFWVLLAIAAAATVVAYVR